MKLSGWVRLWIVASALLASPFAFAQKGSEEDREVAMRRLILDTAEIVGFQTTSTGIQVLYRAKGPGAALVLCTWKTPAKPVASGCVVLPSQ
jgi:hypothetical protein